jgi:hypothetical protein
MELIDYPGFQVRVKQNNNRRAERDEKFFSIKISCKNRIFSICRGA